MIPILATKVQIKDSMKLTFLGTTCALL